MSLIPWKLQKNKVLNITARFKNVKWAETHYESW